MADMHPEPDQTPETVDQATDGPQPVVRLPVPGEQVHGYRLERELGRGAHGVVFLGHGPDGEQVAVKILRKLGKKRLERLRREALALRQLQHPGIVQLRAAFTEGELPCLVLDYVEGRTLSDLWSDTEVLTKLDLLAQVGRAIHHAHRYQIVHRDLKPANVLVHDGVAKITDFGHALDLDRNTRLTETGSSLGTPLYMAPEQVLQGKRQVGPSADIFSLGVMLYEALTGQAPHHGTSLDDQQKALLTRMPTPPSQVDPRLGPDHDRVCLRALAKSPDQRYPTALALARDIELLRNDEVPSTASARSRAWQLLPWGITAAAVCAAIVARTTPAPAPPTASRPPSPTAAPTAQPTAAPPSEPTPTAETTPAPVRISEVPWLTGKDLRRGTRVTVKRSGRWRAAVIVSDRGDAGYDVVFLHGESARLRSTAAFLPDVFLPGAECHVTREDRPDLPGVVIERRGGAVLVEAAKERNWVPLSQVWLQAGQRVPAQATPPTTARVLFAQYKLEQTSYPVVELAREAGRSLVMYLDDGTIEWRGSDLLTPIPGRDAQVRFRPFGKKNRVGGRIVDHLPGLLRVETAPNEQVWIPLKSVSYQR